MSAALLLIPLMPLFLPTQTPDATVVLSVIGLAVLSTSLAFVLYFHLIRQIGPTQTLTVTYLIPLFAITWGYWFLHEPITISISMLTGCAMILLGTALANGIRMKLSLSKADR
ncbi:DMT family transporter [Solemya velesiana gill symbiont]|uniref:DMT family transporter n=1 Tax=Solemya velesiana gill symbiont TaxID=1918948 RepID=UPI001FE982BB|nr:DMT family transporter [Solemya velesiana gill symbiont]